MPMVRRMAGSSWTTRIELTAKALSHLRPVGKPVRKEGQAQARRRDEVTGVGGVGLQLAADGGHVGAEVVGRVLVGGTPDLPKKLGLADDPARAAGEDLDEEPFGRGGPNLRAVAAKEAAGGQSRGEVGARRRA